jgi:rhomboid protease GluP
MVVWRIAGFENMELSPRLRFKVEKWKAAVRSVFAAKEESFDTSHRMCPNCRALVERGAPVCAFCGTALKSPRARAGSAPGRLLGGLIPVPSTATSAFVAANIALYAIAWYLTATAAPEGAASSLGGISGEVLVRLGAKFGPLMMAGQWWRLLTAIFLHAGLLHIGMNLWCLFDLGPEVESLFSTSKFVALYLATGVFGFIVSFLWSPYGLSVGASGAILGLVGILMGASFHHGHLGKAYRGQLWRWVIYIFIFGVFFAVDNAAHLGGLASGALLGYFVPEGEPETRASENLWNALAILCVLFIAGSFALMALQLNRPLG